MKLDRETLRLTLSLPRPDGPFISMNGVERTFVPVVTRAGAKDRQEVAKGLLMRALEMALADHHHQGSPPPDGDVVMAYFRRLLAASPLVENVPASDLEREGCAEMVRVMGVPPLPGRIEREFDEANWGILDPSSTSQGRHINEVFRRADGNPYSLCKTHYENAIGLKHMTSRMQLLRTAFESHLPQMDPEPPLVGNVRNRLSGKNFVTALMDLGVKTFEDSTVVSESAAARMTCRRVLRQAFTTREPVRLLVTEGSPIDPKGPIALIESKDHTIRARRIAYPAVVTKIEEHAAVSFGLPARKYVLTFEARIPLRTGDKISGRHGNKGVAWVVPDAEMPLVTCPWDPSKTIRADVCMSPFSVVKRRMMSLLWEMMAANRARAKGEIYTVGPWEVPGELSFEKLTAEGHGRKRTAWLGDHRLEYPVFAGLLYWIRLDKLAPEGSSSSDDRLHVGPLGLSMDQTKNGQRRDPSKSMAMFHRGLKSLLASSALRSTMDVNYLEELAGVLEPGFRLGDLVEPTAAAPLIKE